ncbi:MAG: luciferase family protein [Rhizobiaceae bacterium]
MSNSKVVFSSLVAALLSVFLTIGSAYADETQLPQREGPRPQTTPGVPHVQIGINSIPEIDAQLLRMVSKLPDVDVRPTIVSLPGAQGFWINENLKLAHPEVIVGGREFAHVHPDGSLHASLSPGRARQAVAAGWAVRHPWAEQRPGWEGFVMLYTPKTTDELGVVYQLIVDSYNFVTGRNHDPDG